MDFDLLPYFSFIIAFTALECPASNWSHKIADFLFLPMNKIKLTFFFHVNA